MTESAFLAVYSAGSSPAAHIIFINVKPTEPHKKTTLVLTAAFQAIGFSTARSAIRTFICGTVRGVDVDGNIYGWQSWNARKDFPEDTPSLRSSHAEFPVPTIVVIPSYFAKGNTFEKNSARVSSLRQIYNIYDQTCDYCNREIPFKLATKDHVIPRSKGGSNYDSNIVLACKKCNNRKADRIDYTNSIGNHVKPKFLSDIEYIVKADNLELRAEWEQFMFSSKLS